MRDRRGREGGSDGGRERGEGEADRQVERMNQQTDGRNKIERSPVAGTYATHKDWINSGNVPDLA